MVPQVFQARQLVLGLRQLHLHFGLACLHVAAEDREDQLRAVNHVGVDFVLNGLLLAWAQFIVEHHDLGTGLGHQRRDLGDFAFADVRARVDVLDVLVGLAHDGHTGGFSQRLEFIKGVIAEGLVVGQDGANKDGKLVAVRELVYDRAFCHGVSDGPSSSITRVGFRARGVGFSANAESPRP